MLDAMRIAAGVVALAACTYQAPPYGQCGDDTGCAAGELCARSGQCLAPAELAPPIALAWTFHGARADAVSCARYPMLQLVLISDNGDPNLALADIPCAAPLVLDRVPRHLRYIELGIAGHPVPARFPDPYWDSRFVGEASSLTFALAP